MANSRIPSSVKGKGRAYPRGPDFHGWVDSLSREDASTVQHSTITSSLRDPDEAITLPIVPLLPPMQPPTSTAQSSLPSPPAKLSLRDPSLSATDDIDDEDMVRKAFDDYAGILVRY